MIDWDSFAPVLSQYPRSLSINRKFHLGSLEISEISTIVAISRLFALPKNDIVLGQGPVFSRSDFRPAAAARSA
jgi:hypothetical protein